MVKFNGKDPVIAKMRTYLPVHIFAASVDVELTPNCVCEQPFEFPTNAACLHALLPYQVENLTIVAFELHSHFLILTCQFVIEIEKIFISYYEIT